MDNVFPRKNRCFTMTTDELLIFINTCLKLPVDISTLICSYYEEGWIWEI